MDLIALEKRITLIEQQLIFIESLVKRQALHRVDLIADLHQRIAQYVKQFQRPIPFLNLVRTIGNSFKRVNLNLREVLLGDPEIKNFMTPKGGYLFILTRDVEKLSNEVLLSLVDANYNIPHQVKKELSEDALAAMEAKALDEFIKRLQAPD